MNLKERIHLLGAPFSSADRHAFETAILERFAENPEAAFSYVNGITDRQIAKAGGLLAYNSIVFAALQFNGLTTTAAKLASGLSLTAAVLLLLLLYVRWGAANEYRDPMSDFQSATKTCCRRAIILTIALALSLVATAVTFWTVAAR